jgi:putative transposase
MAQDRTPASFAALSEDQWVQAMARLAVLRPHLDDDVPLTRTAAAAGVPLRTAQRWLARFRRDGLAGLTRASRRMPAVTACPPTWSP